MAASVGQAAFYVIADQRLEREVTSDPIPGSIGQSPNAAESKDSAGRSEELSYKFQRLREKLRAAILSGEFQGKLPGERQLAKRFHVNAKTLSKALTDLAAEGLLDRSIGRGTFVKGMAPIAAVMGRWLVLTDAEGEQSPLAKELAASNSEVTFCTNFQQIRPSFLNGFSAVIDLGGVATESLLRDLVVRTFPIVTIGAEPRTYAMHAVTPDLTLAALKIGRDLLLAGHRRLVAVEAMGRTAVAQALRQAVTRYAPEAVVDSCSAAEVVTLLGDGAVAFVCESIVAATLAKAAIVQNANATIALTAVGICSDGNAPCSGYYVSPKMVVDAAISLLREPPTRPATIWLTAHWTDTGTLSTTAAELGKASGDSVQVAGGHRLAQQARYSTLPA